MNPWAIGALAWLPASVIAALAIGRLLRRREQAPAPAPSPGQAPASPGAGARPLPQAADSPDSPGTGPQRTLTVHYYDDGHAEVLFHRTRRRLHVRGAGAPSIDLSDAALREWLDDQR